MNSSRPDSLWPEAARAACLYAALTLVLAYPLTVKPFTTTINQGPDTDLLLWLLAWDVHALLHDPVSIFDANIYFPKRHTLAYAENIIGSGLLAAPVIWTTGNLVFALNAVTLLSTVLCGAGTYVLVRRVGFSRAAALVGGLIFAFAPPRFIRLGQPHLAAVQWIPFALASLHHYFDTGRRRSLWWACGFFALQVYTSGHGAVFAAISIALLLVWRFALGEPLRPVERLRDLGGPGTLLLAAAVLPFFAYRASQLDVGLRRTMGDAYAYAPNLATLLASVTYLHAYILSFWPDRHILGEAKAMLFPGYLALVLGAVGVWTLRSPSPGPLTREGAGWRRLAFVLEIAAFLALAVAVVATALGGFRLHVSPDLVFSARNVPRTWASFLVLAIARLALVRKVPLEPRARAARLTEHYRNWAQARRGNAVAFYTVLALLSFWLLLGPEFWLYWFVYDLPGFNFIRVMTRYSLITLLALSVLAAAGFDRLTSRVRPSRRLAVVVAVCAVLTIEYAGVPFDPTPYRVEVPEVDRWLDTRAKPFAVAELPLGSPQDWVGSERRHSTYMLHSTAHWQKTVHGYSGIRPELHTHLYNDLLHFPDEGSLVGLTSLGVNYLVIHTDYYAPGEWDKVQARLPRFENWMTLEHVEGAGRVYSLHRPSPETLLKGKHAEYKAALAGGDTEALRRLYDHDALVVRPDGRILRGEKAISEWLAASPQEATGITLESASFNVPIGSINGRFTLAAGPPRGGAYHQVWKIADDRWRLAADLFSLDGLQP